MMASSDLRPPLDPVAMAQPALFVQAGTRAPFCYGMTVGLRFYSFEEQAGRAAVVIVARDAANPDLRPLLADFGDQASAFTSRGADIVVLGTDDVIRAANPSLPPDSPIQMIHCMSGTWANKTMVFVMDRNLRVATLPPVGQSTVAVCLRALDALPSDTPRRDHMPAPVLLLPNLLPPEVCVALIERFESGASVEGGMASIGADGQPCCRIDRLKKNRRDLLIAPGDDIHDLLRNALLDRCRPEIAKAFQTKITHTDRILIARYDAPAGLFTRHRDNRGANVAFREFAISVNLNTEYYEGGYLTFPEYNDHQYAPSTGGGIIFSASLLHEAAAVSRGSRYVLLTFLHSEGAEARRVAYDDRKPEAD